MSHDIKFRFMVNKSFNLKEMQKAISIASGKKISADSIKFRKSELCSDYFFEFPEVNQGFTISFYYYPSDNALLFFTSYHDYTQIYCIKLIKKIYPLLKCGGWGNISPSTAF